MNSLYHAIIFLSFFLVTTVMGGNPDADFDAFGEQCNLAGLPGFHRVLKIPIDSEVVSVSENQRVVNEFTWWNSSLLQQDLIPSDSLINILIKLVSGKGNSPDYARMEIVWQSKPCLIAQTGGGFGGNTYVCFPFATDFAELSPSQQMEQLQHLIEETSSKRVSENISNYILNKSGNIWVATFSWEKHETIKIVLNNSLICIQIPKVQPNGRIPAYMPTPENWFNHARLIESQSKNIVKTEEQIKYEKEFEARLKIIKGNRQ